jgi:hypothetical protein
MPLEVPGSGGARPVGAEAPMVEGIGVAGAGMPHVAPPDAQQGTPPTPLGPAT